MAKEDDVVAAAMAKPIRDGYPKLTEDHPFFGKLRAFTNKKIIGLERLPTYLPKCTIPQRRRIRLPNC